MKQEEVEIRNELMENLINWYPFSSFNRVLIADGRNSAFLPFLKESFNQVDTLDGKVGNEYDYIIITPSYSTLLKYTNKNIKDSINNLLNLLNKKGHLLFVCKNKLGLKYLNGAIDQDTHDYYSYINHKNNNDVFSYDDLNKMFESYNTRIYYPYPDYHCVNEIFSDESIDDYHYGRPSVNIDNDRYVLFDESYTYEELIKQHLTKYFASCYFIDVTKDKVNNSIIYSKINSDRNPSYKMITNIIQDHKGKHIEKVGLGKESINHMSRLYESTLNYNTKSIHYLKASKKDNVVNYPFINTPNLDQIIEKDINDKEYVINAIKTFFNTYYDELEVLKNSNDFYNDIFKEMFGNLHSNKSYDLVKNVNIDVIMDNIYLEDDYYTIIDGEWIYNDYLPFKFVVWRSLNELYAKHTELAETISRQELMNHFDIDEEDEELFNAWGLYFANKYVGVHKRIQCQKETKNISLDTLRNRKVQMTLYYDLGNGYNEAQKLVQYVVLEGDEFNVSFDIPDNVKKVRFDPINQMCKVNIYNLTDYKILSTNTEYQKDDYSYFLNNQPYYEFDTTGLSFIKLEGSLVSLNDELLQDELSKNYNHNNSHIINGYVLSTIYYDYGNGFNENEKEIIPVNIVDSNYALVMDFRNKEIPERILFNPIKGVACRMSIHSDYQWAKIVHCNQDYEYDSNSYFMNKNPQYIIELDDIDFLTLSTKIELIEGEVYNESLDALRKYYLELDFVKDELTAIKNSTTYKYARKINRFVDKIKSIFR